MRACQATAVTAASGRKGKVEGCLPPRRSMPPEVSSGGSLRQWMCRAHNVVNRSLDKPAFNCALVDARWGALDCGEELACDLSLGKPRRR